jgi:hypothetical protein
MATDLKAPIPPDREKTLKEISAADFLTALNASGPSPLQNIHMWPEKKKVEYEIEPTGLANIKLGVILNVLCEKKKLEFEKDFRAESPLKLSAENVFNPGSILGDPAFINQLAGSIAAQLKGGR